MSLNIKCDCCDDVINEPGGLFFSPPMQKPRASIYVRKMHLCRSCSHAVEVHIMDKRDMKQKYPDPLDKGTP